MKTALAILLILARPAYGQLAPLIFTPTSAGSSGDTVKYDNANRADFTAVTTSSISLTVGSETNRYVVVVVAGERGSSAEWKVDSLKDDEGNHFTRIDSLAAVATHRRMELWGRVGVTSGSRTFTWWSETASGSGKYGNIAAISFSGVHQTTPTGTPAHSTGSGATADDDITLAALDMGFSAGFTWNDVTFTGNGTERWEDTAGQWRTAGQTITGTGTTTMSYGLSGTGEFYVHIAVPIKTAQ